MSEVVTFRIEWESGKTVEVSRSDCKTVEEFCSSYFGRGVEVSAKVSVVGAEKPTKSPKAKKEAKVEEAK